MRQSLFNPAKSVFIYFSLCFNNDTLTEVKYILHKYFLGGKYGYLSVYKFRCNEKTSERYRLSVQHA